MEPAPAAPKAAGGYASEPARLVTTYANLILRLSYTYLGSTHDAEDICQTVFLKMLERREPFADAEHERAWVIRTTINLCKNLLASAARRTSVGLETAGETVDERTPGIEEAYVRSEESRAVLEAVAALPQNYRAAVFLHYYEGCSIGQIAQLTDQSEAAVAAHLSRGRSKLRGMLRGDQR